MLKVINTGVNISRLPAPRTATSLSPQVDTGKTFSACRPIVGVSDQHGFAQFVSNAVAYETIRHTVHLPQSEQVIEEQL